MQSAAISPYAAPPLLRSSTKLPAPRWSPLLLPLHRSGPRLRPLAAVPSFSVVASSHGPPVPRPWVSLPSLSDRRPEDGLAVRATSVPDGDAASKDAGGGGLLQTLQLGSLFGLWYLFNIYFNIYNKQARVLSSSFVSSLRRVLVSDLIIDSHSRADPSCIRTRMLSLDDSLIGMSREITPIQYSSQVSERFNVLKVFTFPLTITTVQFAVGTFLVLFMWTTNLYKRPKISASQLAVILPLAMVHTMGNLFTNMSLGKVAVSFTHTIKAMEPFFSVLLSALFLGEESLDNINLFSIITIMSFCLLAPATLFVEGIKVTPSYLQSAGLNFKEIYLRSLLAALCFHAYQQVSYMILARVSPVTHSVGNCVKRVVVIVTSVLFFRTPVSPINSLGTGVALAGVFLYSRVKKIKPKSA
ncbi:hypothetical protein C4D60_Mb01t26320 [Musa balbisiana]|uniref:Sugar phosphate transporter domain-containing protein n=1 Tax=Musa balbisiana TaxID=52838 RepID=A0A4V4H7L7_MUSBA|nr:hypothetical protein C4D60_Mb01t26320 [Musa balbisiana]